jgi:Septum formation
MHEPGKRRHAASYAEMAEPMPILRRTRVRALLVAGLIAVAGCTTEPDAPSPTAEPSSPVATSSPSAEPSASASAAPETSVLDLVVGDCFSTAVAELDRVSVVSCDTEHQYEVFALLELDGAPEAPFPGDQALLERADADCQPSFAAYVGTEYPDSAWFIAGLVPSEETWADGDRTIACALYEPDDFGDPMTVSASAEGSAR